MVKRVEMVSKTALMDHESTVQLIFIESRGAAWARGSETLAFFNRTFDSELLIQSY